jgi:integrase
MARRISGVFKRKNRWVAQPYIIYANGEKKRTFISADTYEDVVYKLQELKRCAIQQIPCNKNNWTISAYLDYWLHDVKQHSIRESTMQSYKTMIDNHLKPALGSHKLKTLSEQNIEHGINLIIQNGFAGSVAQKCLQIMITCLKRAVKEKLILTNVALLVEKPEYTPKETMIWIADQTAIFLEAIKDHPQYIAFLLLFTYGMRRGEVLGLRWSDIDFENNNIHVRQQIGRINGCLKASKLKTKNSFRVIPLDMAIRMAIIEHAKKNIVEIPPFNPHFKLSTQGTIVTSNAGTPLDPRNLIRIFHNLSKQAGLPRIKVHATRHIAATNFKDVNMPIVDAQKVLGHAKPETTLKFYQHGTTETQRIGISAAVKRLKSY